MTLRLAHLADLHFGEDVPGLGEHLAGDIRAQAPDAVLVSGDLTRRARPAELSAAFAFLAGLGPPVLAVPGNHDIPATDLRARLLHPRRLWHGAAPSATQLHLPHLTVLGLDTTARGQWHLDWSAGAISPRRLAGLGRQLVAASATTSVVLCHHPLAHPPGIPGRRLPRGAEAARTLLRDAGVRAVLSGHLHRPAALPLGEPWPVNLVAPSALSPRGDGTPNGWLLLEVGTGLRATLRQFTQGSWAARTLFSRP